MESLSLIGCGRAASTLARLWAESGVLQVGDVLTRSSATAAAACVFVGQGRPVTEMGAMRPARWWLLGVSDRSIVPAAQALADSGRLRPGDGVFHLSGFTPAAVLAPLAEQGARIASVHPVMSFADPVLAITRFAGTPCGIAGEASLVAELRRLFAAIGGDCFELDDACKPLYHAGSVFASNYLVVILDVARKAWLDAGVPPEMAGRMLAALSRGALDNVLALGARAALTGPAARGDRDVVAAQQAAVAQWDAGSGEAYAALAELAYRLAAEQHRGQEGGQEDSAD